MRLNSKRIIDKPVKRSIELSSETKDGILWDHLSSQRLCRVKVQASDELIIAYYPEGWVNTPYWLKKGAPIRIMHRGGIRGRIEVVGIGQTVPVAISEGNTPDPDTPDDTVLTGCEIMQIPNSPQMSVMVKTGTYQIDGDEYTLGPIKMGSSSSTYDYGMGEALGEVAGVIDIDAAPSAGYFRYDLIVIGADGTLDYVKGNAFAPDDGEDMPDVPTDHILLGKILLHSGMTTILDRDIDRDYSTPGVSTLDITISDDDLAWTELTSTITVAILDQYGNAIYTSEYGWYITIEFVTGNGTLTSDEEGDSETKVGGHTSSTDNEYEFTYTRDQESGDESPTFLITLESNYTLTEIRQIILRDVSGNIMT